MAFSIIFANHDLNNLWNLSLVYKSYYYYYRKYLSKKSSGKMEPKSNPWLVLKDTTPCPKRRGLILLSKTIDTCFDGLFSDEEDDFDEFGIYTSYQQLNKEYRWNFHRMHVFTIISKSTVTLLPKSTRNGFLFDSLQDNHCYHWFILLDS